jgi:hypothetical protein
VEGELGINGVSKGPNTPAGVAIDGDTGNPIPELLKSMSLLGKFVTHGKRVGGPPIPGLTGNGVGPLPNAGGAHDTGGTNGALCSAPGMSGVCNVVVSCE